MPDKPFGFVSNSNLYPNVPPLPSAPAVNMQQHNHHYPNNNLASLSYPNSSPYPTYGQTHHSYGPNTGGVVVPRQPYPPSPYVGSGCVPPQPAYITPQPCNPPFGIGGCIPPPQTHRPYIGNSHHSASGCKQGYYWVPSNSARGVPPTAVRGGHDQDGTEIFVGRAYHEGDWCPAKVIPSKHIAYIPYGGEEHMKNAYEVLCEQKFQWAHCSGGNVPHNAVEGGRTSSGETLYIGRVHHNGSHTVGKVHPSHRCLYIPFGGQEVKYENYEILLLL